MFASSKGDSVTVRRLIALMPHSGGLLNINAARSVRIN